MSASADARAADVVGRCFHVSQWKEKVVACRECVAEAIRDAEREREGLRRFLAGDPLQVSMGIDELLTYGYGDLDANGFWRYPVPEQIVAMRRALASVVAIAKEVQADWDADKDARVGKILMALAGYRPGYRADIDAIHAALKNGGAR